LPLAHYCYSYSLNAKHKGERTPRIFIRLPPREVRTSGVQQKYPTKRGIPSSRLSKKAEESEVSGEKVITESRKGQGVNRAPGVNRAGGRRARRRATCIANTGPNQPQVKPWKKAKETLLRTLSSHKPARGSTVSTECY
jgi:hypothetical protein